MIEAKLVLGRLEAVFDCPALAFDGHQRLDGCANWTPCGEEGEVAIADVAADQQPASPKARFGLVIFVGVEIGEFAIGPVMKPFTFGSFAGGEGCHASGARA